MKLLTDENDQVVLEDGKPVYEYEDGKRVPFDAPAAMGKIKELNGENKKHRLRADEFKTQSDSYLTDIQKMQKKLESFDGIDVTKAKAAMETLSKFEAKELVEAEKIDVIKQQLQSEFEAKSNETTTNFKQQEEQLQAKLQELSESVTRKDDHIYNLMVKNHFAISPFIRDNIAMTPDVAFEIFKRHYQIEETENGHKMVAYDSKGNKLMSRDNPGEEADFEEAMYQLWDSYPNKDFYTKSKAGSGSSGKVGSQDKVIQDYTTFYSSMS